MRARMLAALAALTTAAALSLSAGGTAAASLPAQHTGPAHMPTEYPTAGTVQPNAVNNLDCNGFSPKYKPAKASMKPLCADPIQKDDDSNGYYKVNDNGHYIGHDEPSVKFESSAPGSGNHMQYFMQLPVDPAQPPTASGSRSIYAMLSPAPWFGLSLCDPNSNPGGACTPDSDSNDPNTAGQAFMELQLYPPGFQPFVDNVSCDATKWCAALTIDSVTCDPVACLFNPNCLEPVNFGYLQTDGVPTGPPSPQLADLATFTPNAKTLKMNQGDTIELTLQDNPATNGSGGLVTTIKDFSTGQTGFMTASANNGFMTTSSVDCSGAPFSFHPTYDTAAKQNMLPWSVLEGGVLMEQEIGHMETCDSLLNPGPVLSQYSNNEIFFDPSTQQTCVGGVPEGTVAGVGEGPCVAHSLVSACVNSTTEGGQPCPQNVGQGVALSCEGSDATCVPAGPRTVTEFSGTTPPTQQSIVYTNPLNECEANQAQNGDLDFDGNSYIADWPDGTPNHPTSMRYIGPFDGAGNAYPNVQIETDLAGSENNCLLASVNAQTCVIPPLGPGNQQTFYPYFTLSNTQGLHGLQTTGCTWDFGNTIQGVTTNDLGKTGEYGAVESRGNFISNVEPNPAISAGCPPLPAVSNLNACAPVFTVSAPDPDTYSVEGQNLGVTTFPPQLDIESGDIQPGSGVLKVKMTLQSLNKTLPPGSGENDYRTAWNTGGTRYFALATVDPAGNVLYWDGQVLVVGPETRYQPLHLVTGHFNDAVGGPNVVEVDVPTADAPGTPGTLLTQIVGETDVRTGTETTGLLQTEDVVQQYDYLVGQTCGGGAAVTPEAPLAAGLVGGGLLATGLVAWRRTARRRQVRA